MKDLLKELRQDYDFDYIILDTPPVLGLADSVIISSIVDGLILIVSLDNVDRSLPKNSINRIKISKSNLIGMVTNESKETKSSDKTGYGYNNAYRYGYGNIYTAYNKYAPP